ncbi:MAG: ThuA domain-containing protein [Lachnospiraceae bacterium]|nr:ThuA domain-containing protein [Lachnospiraceae bacterium]
MQKHSFLLLGTYADEAPYHPIDPVEDIFREIFNDIGELKVTDKVGELKDLSQYDGVISFLDVWDRSPVDAEAEMLVKYVENGGALLVLHNGICISQNESLKSLTGGSFVSHPEQEILKYTPLKHEITEGIAPFSLKEEPYRFDFADSARTLLLNYSYRGEEYPAAWCREVGDGRVVYLSPGHTAEQFKEPEYRKLIRNSLLWCLKAQKSCGIVPFTVKDNEIYYLLIKQTNDVVCFPKGHVEEGETEKETALRECMEETNIKAEILDGFRDEMVYYMPEYDKYKQVIHFVGKIDSFDYRKQDEEISSMMLCTYDEALEMFRYQNLKDLLVKADAFLAYLFSV